MSRQYPQQPPYAQQPQQPQPKKRGVGKIAGLGCAGILVLLVVGGIATGGGKGDPVDHSAKDKAVAAPNDSAKEAAGREKAPAERSRTQAEEFRACVLKSGTPTEKSAVAHVTKVTGADKRNDVLDAPEVFTDFSGGLAGPHQGEGKLIASAFTSCYESDNGLVTVYDRNGEVLANANY
ncbi:hypothetical protein [Streptomyces hilarionis]|uniref:hypothetical protein n=1 Tax=Streptomyces hilarionis TaxID=2839954 RepID=UPI002119ED5A|nr:hypothetical protein [Streptomyces hilarionis]MCQ9133777.1 hypothetical protein [Streptomyces hilarionis]